MGAFAISTRCSHGRIGHQVVHNYLMCRAHCRLLRRVFPPTSGGPFTCKIGFSGPMYRDTTDRPNYDIRLVRARPPGQVLRLWSANGATRAAPGPRTSWPSSTMPSNPVPATWTLTDDGLGTIIDTGWHTWTNRNCLDAAWRLDAVRLGSEARRLSAAVAVVEYARVGSESRIPLAEPADSSGLVEERSTAAPVQRCKRPDDPMPAPR